MPEPRTLPIPVEHREFTVKVDGEAVGRENQLLAATISKSANRISSARLVYLDGSASSSDFPLSNADTMVPGRAVEVLAGAGNNPVAVFTGVVVRQSIKIREHTAPQLIVECRHRAAKMTGGRKNAYFAEQSDSDIITGLIRAAGLAADVDSTVPTHKQQVQYRATDWDFLIARAEANGRLVFTNGEAVTVKAPDLGSEPVCSFQFGATILELDADIDARGQFKSVTGMTWNPAEQEVVTRQANDPAISTPGNLATDQLAEVLGLEGLDLRDSGITDEEAQVWADAQWLRSKLGRVNGRLKTEGLATINPGDRALVAGVGDRFSGDIYVVGVRHDFDPVQGWKTHVQFGAPPGGPLEDPGPSAPPAGALLPAVRGLQLGVVTGNEDPEGEHRVRIRIPLVGPDDDGTWARVASLDAGDDRGWFIRPEIGDEVVVGFVEDDPRAAVILGMLPSSANPAPLPGSDTNHEKVYQSRSGMKVYFNDEHKVMQLETPAGNRITLSEEEQLVRVEDQTGNKIEMNPDGITLKSTKAVSIESGTEMKLKSGTSFDVEGGTELKLEGSAGAELSSPTTARLKGSLVQIN